jgi:hypothetical protein
MSITEKEFDAMLKEQKQYETQKWADLKIGKLYTITNTKIIDTAFGESTILTIEGVGEVWAPSSLAEKIKTNTPPFYVRPNGLKPCRNNKHKYHSYDLIT